MAAQPKGKAVNRGIMMSEAEFRRIWSDRTTPVTEIGRRLGISHEAVRCRAKIRGLPPRTGPRPHMQKIDCPDFAKMYLAHVSLGEIARHYCCDYLTARRAAMRLGLPRRYTTTASAITVAEYQQRQAALSMAQAAAIEQSALRNAEMTDKTTRWVQPARIRREASHA